MPKELTMKQQKLSDFMSEISERCYYAGWMKNLEYVLWDALFTGQRKYGQDYITLQEIEVLKKLSKEANCWIIYDSTSGEAAIEKTLWEDKFSEEIIRDPNILKG